MSDLHPNGHLCGRCKEYFPEFMFHVGAGYCDDCYNSVQEEIIDEGGAEPFCTFEIDPIQPDED